MRIALIVLFIVGLAACQDDSSTYTLYRNGLDLKNNQVDESARFYIASFGEPADIKYNQANCLLAAEALNKEQVHYQGTIYSKLKINYCIGYLVYFTFLNYFVHLIQQSQ
jgi:hypothetical protein